MITVGVRELKSQLSYYLQLVQAGEEIAIRMRNKVIGYLSSLQPEKPKKLTKRKSKRDLGKLIEEWKKEGFVLSGGVDKYRPHKPAKMTPGPTSTEIIRKMRDEGW